MKIILVVYNEALDADVMDLLKACGQAEFTKWTKVLGQGAHSEPHLLSHVWPKANNCLMTCVSDAQAAQLMAGVRGLRKTMSHEGIKAFMLPVESAT